MAVLVKNRKSVDHFDAHTVEVLVTTGIRPEGLCEASRSQLLSLQAQLLMGNQWGAWEVEPSLIGPAGVLPSRRTYRLESMLPVGMDPCSESAERVWCETLRVAIALRLWPGEKGRRYKYPTIHLVIRRLAIVTRHIASIDSSGFWSRITRDEAVRLFGAGVVRQTGCLTHLCRLGAIPDCLRPRKRPKGVEPARDRTGEPEIYSPTESYESYQPFSDAFVAEAGWNAIHMIQLVGPALLDALDEAARAWEARVSNDVDPDRSYSAEQRAKTLDPIVENWRWLSSDGDDLRSIPMQATFRATGVGNYDWPPRTHHQAWSMLPVLQGAHLWCIALVTAGRHLEIQSLKEGGVQREDTHTPTAVLTTWKLDGPAGRPHEAPLPNLAVLALRQQERLARLVKNDSGVGGDHLWVSTLQYRGQPLLCFRRTLDSFIAAFSLESLLEGRTAHMHRFRKTLVRIVALSLVHAPKILMDILCHRDEQMTVLRYILSDLGTLSDVQETVRELVILKGVEAIEKRDQLQGTAAAAIQSRVASYAKRLGHEAMEPKNLTEFASAMTEGGTNWAVIAPGIICTGFTRGGMCNKSQGGVANPHYCNPACENQLVMPAYEGDGKLAPTVILSLENMDYLLRKLADADTNGEEMLIAQFAGQVRALLGRWREVDKHVVGHPMLVKYLPDVIPLT